MSADLNALVTTFASNIRFDCHSLTLKFGRSEAGRELRAHASKETIAAVASYLAKQPAADLNTVEGDVNVALAMMLSALGHQLKIYIPQELVLGDRPGWIAWASRIT